MTRPTAGLLPLYLQLYDDLDPSWRAPLEDWLGRLAGRLESLGLGVLRAPPCRRAAEFQAAVAAFEAGGADALITVHLAYSPSLESIDALAASRLPLVVLSTTPDPSFDALGKLMANHGIHGVQDLCNLLLRRGRRFAIEAGHWEGDVLERAACHVRAARISSALRAGRVGLVGRPFAGMGDFQVPEDGLRAALGVTTVPVSARDLAALLPAPGDPEVAAELAEDRQRFAIRDLAPATHEAAVRAGLAVRRLVRRERLTAVTMNFQEVTTASGLPAMPFHEFSKAMSRGTGYAGEGDALTAALAGAVLSVYPASTFTEIFCPDWKTGTLFLSHMGEMNVNLAADRPLLTGLKWIFSDAGGQTAVAYGCLKPGPAVLVNLAPAREGFRLVLAPVDMQPDRPEGGWERSVRGWARPRLDLSGFLEAYSRAGGTHHSVLVYGGDEVLRALGSFGRASGFDTRVLDGRP